MNLNQKNEDKKIQHLGTFYLILFVSICLLATVYLSFYKEYLITWRLPKEDVLHYGLNNNLANLLVYIPSFLFIVIILFYIAYILVGFLPYGKEAIQSINKRAEESRDLQVMGDLPIKTQDRLGKLMLIFGLLCCPLISFFASNNYYYITPKGISINSTFQESEETYSWHNIKKVECLITTAGQDNDLRFKYILIFSESQKIDLLTDLGTFFENYNKLKPYLNSLRAKASFNITEDGRRAWNEDANYYKKEIAELMRSCS